MHSVAATDHVFRNRRSKKYTFWVTVFFLCTTACSSGEVILPTGKTADIALGKAQGEACGVKIVSTPGALALDFIPIQFNDRLDRAVERAIDSVPRAKGLQNIEIRETWFYFILGMARCVIVTGDAVK